MTTAFAPQKPVANATPPDMASLLCSRMCHDLLSPIGAMANGLELLAEETDPAMRQRCMELLEQSARASADKLKFFRLAFGAAGGFGELVPVAEPRALIEALVAQNDRITLGWSCPLAGLGKPAVKILLNLALLGIEALVRGGALEIAIEPQPATAGWEIAVSASGPKIAFDGRIREALAGRLPASELTGRTAPAAMIAGLAAAAGGVIQIAESEAALVLGVALGAG